MFQKNLLADRMKWCWVLLIWLSSGAGAQASRSGPGPSSSGAMVTVGGTVLDSLTQKPLDAVHVMLTFYASEAEPSIVYGAVSNAHGRFSIPDIPPGEYSILPEKHGFIFVPDRKKNNIRFDGAQRMRFTARERPYDLVLPMVARGIIAGRVLDEHGDPLINATARAESLNRETEASVQTNGRGEFRLSVPPGKYYVEGSRWSDSDMTSESGYVPTYYPGATGIEGASPVEAFAGRVLNGVEFSLVRSVSLRVSGEITGLPDGDRSLSLWWKPADRDEIRQTGRESGRLDFNTRPAEATSSSVKFYSLPLDAGTYYFYAVSRADNEELQSQVAELTLSDSDVTGVTLSLAPAAEITGTIAITGGPVAPPGQKISVVLKSDGPANFGSRLEGEIDANGSFRITNVSPDRYRLNVEPLLEYSYVRRIEMNGSALHGRLLDFLRGAEGVEFKIDISADGAGITGRVRKRNSDVPVPYARVLLFPEHDDLSVDKDECQDETASDGGIYNFQHLAPGRYRFLVRRPSRLRDDCEQAAAALRQGLIAAETVELKANKKTVKNARVVDEVSDESRP